MYQRDLDDLDAGPDRETHVAQDENDDTVDEEYVFQIPEGERMLFIRVVPRI